MPQGAMAHGQSDKSFKTHAPVTAFTKEALATFGNGPMPPSLRGENHSDFVGFVGATKVVPL